MRHKKYLIFNGTPGKIGEEVRPMAYDKRLIAGKLRRWEKYLQRFELPTWEELPDFGLYMEQVITLMKQYLDYLPPELKEEQFITPATINNYVRTKVMPEPNHKRYFREHLAYLIIILTLKQSLSIAMISKIIPMGISEDEVKKIYSTYVVRHAMARKIFNEQIRMLAGPILDHENCSEMATEQTEDVIAMAAVMAGFQRLMSEKLLLLDGRTLEDGDTIEIEQ